MSGSPPSERHDEAFWTEFLTRGHATETKVRRVFKHIPDAPRCKLCAAPFGGVGAPLMRLIGKRPSNQNPAMCATCFDFIVSHHGGAEIECSFLFADVRGSTTIAEGTTATSFRGLLDRFYGVASATVIDHDGSVDKFVGDELMATFFPLLSGERHAAKAVTAARALLRATGHADPAGPWLPIGAGVHSGIAWVGAVGEGPHTELTALGDTVNTTARLSAAAEAGEILVSDAAARAAGLADGLPRRSLDLKGKATATAVVSLGVDD